MQTIWHRPGWLYPVLWLLSKWDLIFPETGKDVPANLTISSQSDQAGEPVQVWERTFYFAVRIRRRYRSIMLFDAGSKRIVKLQGRNNIFEEIAEIHICPPDTIEFLTVKSVLRLGRMCIPLPEKLWITAHVVQRATQPGKAASRVELTLTHGVLGAIFGYKGTFRATRTS